MIALQPYIETRKTADDPYVILKSKIDIGSAHIGIIGMGYVGLPLALAFAAKGITVLGFDNDRTKVEQAATGRELYQPHSRTSRSRRPARISTPPINSAGWPSRMRF